MIPQHPLKWKKKKDETCTFALSLDWLSIFRLMSDEAIRMGVCARGRKNIKVRGKPYPQWRPFKNRLKWAVLVVSNAISHFERCNNAIRQSAQREGGEGKGSCQGGFNAIKQRDREWPRKTRLWKGSLAKVIAFETRIFGCTGQKTMFWALTCQKKETFLKFYLTITKNLSVWFLRNTKPRDTLFDSNS